MTNEFLYYKINFINFYSLSLFFPILAELDDMSGNLSKTHIFTLLYPTNPISHLGRSKIFLDSIFSIYFSIFIYILWSLFYNFVLMHLQKEKENIPLKVTELPQVTLYYIVNIYKM